MGYVIVDLHGKRIRDLESKLTPYFDHPAQALQYIRKHCGNSPGAFIHEVD